MTDIRDLISFICKFPELRENKIREFEKELLAMPIGDMSNKHYYKLWSSNRIYAEMLCIMNAEVSRKAAHNAYISFHIKLKVKPVKVMERCSSTDAVRNYPEA